MPVPLKAGFCGSGEFAAECLRIISARDMPGWVITNAPRPAGRGLKLRPTPVNTAALELGIKCFTTEKLSADTERVEWIKNNLPDVILVIDFGQMIKEPLLSMARLGCVNIHPSMLPAYRGSAPVQRAIMDGLSETGTTLFRLDAGMDTGPVLARVPVAIGDGETTPELLDRCAKAGADEMLRWLCSVPADEWQFTSQSNEGLSLAGKIDKSEGRIDWTYPSGKIFCLIRALAESPGTFCMAGGKRLRVRAASLSSLHGDPGRIVAVDGGMPVVACGSGALKLVEVQPEGKKRQSAADWLRGSRLKAGDTVL